MSPTAATQTLVTASAGPKTTNYPLVPGESLMVSPGHLSPLIPRDDNIISGQCPPSQQPGPEHRATNSSNFIIHSTPILDKEDQRIVIFPHFAPNLRYFFSVSKSNNMKGNAAETFIKPTLYAS